MLSQYNIHKPHCTAYTAPVLHPHVMRPPWRHIYPGHSKVIHYFITFFLSQILKSVKELLCKGKRQLPSSSVFSQLLSRSVLQAEIGNGLKFMTLLYEWKVEAKSCYKTNCWREGKKETWNIFPCTLTITTEPCPVLFPFSALWSTSNWEQVPED